MNTEKIKAEAISFAQTFVTLFIIDLGIIASQVPLDQLISGEAFTSAFVIGILAAAVRTAIKGAWAKVMPVKLGGKDK